MELSLKNTSLFLAILLTGLSAGLFYAWEVSVIPGTKKIADHSYLEAMQSINRAILNPAFYTIFFGSLLLLFSSAFLQYKVTIDWSFWLILIALVSYLIGTFGVTMFGNVPLNEALDVVQLKGLAEDALGQQRKIYETQWNRLHTIRTVFSVLAFMAILLSAFVNHNHYE